MATPLEVRYRARLATIRQRVTAAVRRIYLASVNGADLDAEFGRIYVPTASLVAAGQAQGRATANGYLAALITLGAARTAVLPVLSLASISDLATRMEAWPSMVKQQIGEGRALPEALDFGRYLAERFADAEVVGAVDAQTDLATQESGQFAGWIGITTGRTTCEPCYANQGFHLATEKMYRHAGCDCRREYLVN